MEIALCSDLVRELLLKRGIQSDEDIASFLNPDYAAHTHPAELLPDIDTAVDRLLQAIARGERIAIYADFDCDGIPGASILYDLLRKIGHEHFEVYIPHRDREGYGFHIDAIDALKSRGVSLVITVDVGTVAFDSIAHARSVGIDVIVTDHHEIQGALPDAIVINPKREPYPFPHLCGAGVAFKLVQATLREGKRREFAAFAAIPDGWEKWLLDLVAIATVADMVPLIGENRTLVHWGLQVLRKSQRPGIEALCNRARMQKRELTEDDIGFSLAPRINAASRMGEPESAFRLLVTHDPLEADRLAAHLEELNASRKGIVGSIVKNVRAHVATRFTDEDRVVVLGNPEWKPALLGLVANSIMSDRGGVVCLWGRDANGTLKGSCRSDGETSLMELFAAAPDAVEEFGGHEASGGFTVSSEQVHNLHERLKVAMGSLARAASGKQKPAPDLEIPLSGISWPLLKEVSRLAPFGIGNPKPLFAFSPARVTRVNRFGKSKDHIEVEVSCMSTGMMLRTYDFFRSPEDFTTTPAQGTAVRVVGTIERDSFRRTLAVRIVDIFAA